MQLSTVMNNVSKLIMGSSKKPKKKQSICFSPSPIIHEIDTSSPALRRLELRKSRVPIHEVDEKLIEVEAKARGLEPKSDDFAQALQNEFNMELRQELEALGLQVTGTNEELCARLELANALRRRAHLRMLNLDTMPADMTRETLDEELGKRRIVVHCSSTKSRVVALEEALLKEGEGLIGEGYEFGRRFISTEDFVYALEPKEISEALRGRGLQPPRKRSQKFAMLQELLDTEQENCMREFFRSEILADIKRLNLSLEPLISETIPNDTASQETGIAHLSASKIVHKVSSSATKRKHATGPASRKSAAAVTQSTLAAHSSSKKRSREHANLEEELSINMESVAKKLKFDSLADEEEAEDKRQSKKQVLAVDFKYPDSPETPKSRASASPSPLPGIPDRPSSSEEDPDHISTDQLFEFLFSKGVWKRSVPKSPAKSVALFSGDSKPRSSDFFFKSPDQSTM